MTFHITQTWPSAMTMHTYLEVSEMLFHNLFKHSDLEKRKPDTLLYQYLQELFSIPQTRHAIILIIAKCHLPKI